MRTKSSIAMKNSPNATHSSHRRGTCSGDVRLNMNTSGTSCSNAVMGAHSAYATDSK